MKTDIAGHEFSYNAAEDLFTFSGHKITGEFLRTIAVTPCGITFRIVERKDGAITVTQDRDKLASAAPAMLSALELALSLLLVDAEHPGLVAIEDIRSEVVINTYEAVSAAIAQAKSA